MKQNMRVGKVLFLIMKSGMSDLIVGIKYEKALIVLALLEIEICRESTFHEQLERSNIIFFISVTVREYLFTYHLASQRWQIK